MKWYELSNGYIKTDIVLSNQTSFIQFISELEQTINSKILRSKYLNKYNIVKKTIMIMIVI